jgi:hypothetical protein
LGSESWEKEERRDGGDDNSESESDGERDDHDDGTCAVERRRNFGD